jgi:ubiquinone/menaquinone biosynthesis C-methylase UbiE
MSNVDAEIVAHYEQGKEHDRLEVKPAGRLELVRTQILLRSVLPAAPARILDVGGAAGRYAAWLAELGYEVELIDPVPLHVDQAGAVARSLTNVTFTAELGDARALARPDETFDAVLLLGPLYHLQRADDRAKALAEARRVLRPGGVVAAAAITRFASTMDGLLRDHLVDESFRAICRADLATGEHRNPERREGYFTTAYFHHPHELGAELSRAGFADVEVRAVEGFAGLLADLDDRLDDPARRAILLDTLALVDAEPALAGASFHLLGLGRRSV